MYYTVLLLIHVLYSLYYSSRHLYIYSKCSMVYIYLYIVIIAIVGRAADRTGTGGPMRAHHLRRRLRKAHACFPTRGGHGRPYNGRSYSRIVLLCIMAQSIHCIMYYTVLLLIQYCICIMYYPTLQCTTST